jgi:hypothetical protein
MDYLFGALTASDRLLYNIKEIINCLNGVCELSSQITLGNTQNVVFVSTIY